MKKPNRANIIGMVISFIAIFLGVYWFSWKLAVVVTLAIIGNNLELKGRKYTE